MDAYTIQMAKWRVAKARHVHFIDATIKSGNPLLAPTWELLSGYKSGLVTDEEYTRRYWELLVSSYQSNYDYWVDLLYADTVAFACYCKAHGFCHRYILIRFLEEKCHEHGIDFNYLGELE